MEKYGNWKRALEGEGLRVNVNKSKDIRFMDEKKIVVVKLDQCRLVYNGLSVAIRPSVCALVTLILYTLKRLSSSFFLHRTDVF